MHKRNLVTYAINKENQAKDDYETSWHLSSTGKETSFHMTSNLELI